MPKFQVVRGTHGVTVDGARVVVGPGDVVELTDKQAERLGDKVRPAASGASGAKPKGAVKTEIKPPTDWTDVLNAGVDVVNATIEGLESADELNALADQESKGKARKGVLEAVKARLAAVDK